MSDSNNIDNVVQSYMNFNPKDEQLIEEIQVAMDREVISYPCCGDYIGNLMNGSKSFNSLVELHVSMEQKNFLGSCNTISTSTSAEDLTLFENSPVDYECRYKMCQWFFQVVNYCQLNQGTAQLCISNLDRFLSISPSFLKDREKYQLAAISALYLSIKINNSVKLDMKFLGLLCRGCYKHKDIVAMERIILDTLSWKVNPPASIFFVERFLCFVSNLLLSFKSHLSSPKKEKIDVFERLAVEQTDLCTMNCSISCSSELYKASEIAFASLLNSLEAVFGDNPSGVSSLKEILCEITSQPCFSFDRSRMQLLRLKIGHIFLITYGCSLKTSAKEWNQNRIYSAKESFDSSSSELHHQESYDRCSRQDKSCTPNSIEKFK